MDLLSEHEKFLLAVVPSVIGTEHFVVLPHVRAKAEPGGGKVAAVLQAGSLDEGGVHVHVHLVVEHKELGLGVIGAVEALYHLAVLVPHGAAVLEDGYGILGVVVQVFCTEGVLVLVYQLHKVSAELGQVLIHHILQGVAGKGCAVLDDAHVPHCVYDIGVDVPICCVAEEVGVVVKEFGGPGNLPVAFSVNIQKLGAFGLYEQHLVLCHKGR